MIIAGIVREANCTVRSVSSVEYEIYGPFKLKELLQDLEKSLIIEHLKRNTSIAATAREIGLERTTLVMKIGNYKINKKKYLKPIGPVEPVDG